MKSRLSWKFYLSLNLLCIFCWGNPTCSPGCLDYMLGDEKCDEECNNLECEFDNHYCGQCASGCFPKMLENGICNPECNNEDCLYDYNDCQCAKNCTWQEYGNCKPECLVPSCNYDQIRQYPNSWCQNTSLAIFSSYQQIIHYDFSYVARIEDCYETSNYSCTLEKVFELSNCYEECNILECNYANGNCDDYFQGCLRPYNNSYGCLSCMSYGSFKNVLGYRGCFRQDDYSYFWQFPDSTFTEILLIDTSSAKNPHVYFVSGSADTSGDGSYLFPYTFSDISKIHHSYAIVYLLEDGEYFLKTPEVYYGEGQSWSPSYADILFDSLSQKNIKITTFNNTRVTIKRLKDNDNIYQIFWFSLKNVTNFEISNVIFDWKDTISTCKDENSCDYCRTVIYDPITGLNYNDRGEVINDFLLHLWCESNKHINFFEVRDSNLVLNNVTFRNFRCEFNSLIYVVNGNVTLNNVIFDNIKVNDEEKSAVIVWNSINNEKYNSGSLKFINGVVKRLNNGYELKNVINTNGFLYATNITSAIFKNVEFRSNLMLRQSLRSMKSTSILFLSLFQELLIDSCAFVYNYCDTGIIYIEQHDNYYQNSVNNLEEIIYSKLNHIHIKNSNFTSNYGKTAGILYAIYKDEIQNWFIENTSFAMNGVENGPMIHLESKNLNVNYVNDTMINVIMPDGSINSAKYFAKWGKIYNSNFTKNYSGGNGMLEIIKMINVELKDVQMISNGMLTDEMININSIILKYYIEDSSLYPTLSIVNPLELNCMALSSISESINFYLKSVQVQNNYCKNFSPNFIISKSENFTIEHSYFLENNGSGRDGSCLAITEKFPMTIKHTEFRSNKNRHSGGAGAVSSASNLLIINCTFSKNIGSGALYFIGQFLNVTSSYFDSNKSPNSHGGCIYFLMTSEISEAFFLYISNSTFTNNYSYLYGGAIYFHSSNIFKYPLLLSFIDTVFLKNQAQSGSCFYIDESVPISIDSSIANCKFKENQSRSSAAIVLFFTHGILNFFDCYFNENTGSSSSVLSIAIGENSDERSSKIITSHCVFQYNSGNTIISLENTNLNSTLQMLEALFEYNTGSVYSLDNDYVFDKHSIVQHNYSPNSGGVLNIKNSAIFYSEGSTYFNNTSKLNGGVASISLESRFFCRSCNFTKNNAESSGGVIYTDSEAHFSITDSILSKNSCQKSGSAIFMVSTSSVSSINNSEISENHSYNKATLSLSSSQMVISSTKIYKNSAEKNPSIDLEDSSINVINSEFSNQSGDQGCFLILGSSYASIINTTFFDGFSDKSGVAIRAISSSLHILSSTFSRLFTGTNGAAIYLYENSIISIKNSTFINTNCSFDAYLSTISVKDTIFKEYSNSAISAANTDLDITNSKFSYGYGTNGGAIYCADCSKVSISSSSFANNIADNGGAVYIQNDVDHSESYQLIITSSSFVSNIAGNGGAIWANNANLQINNVNFTENYAEAFQTNNLEDIIDGVGGAIKISCQGSISICHFDLSENSFSNNSATYNGGAINWDDSKPSFNNNIFQNNSAQYGNDIASFPTMIIFLNGITRINTDVQIISENSTELTLNNIVSGQENNPSLIFALIDDLNQIIRTNFKSQAQMQAINDNEVITGISIVESKNGIFNFEGYIMLAKPGSSSKISITSSAIDFSKTNTSANTLSISQSFLINANFRLCEIGEATIGLSCETCPEFYYNIDADDSKCLDCPSSAICYGNYTMVPKSGYWRDNKLTDIFWKCPYPPACLGSPDLSNISLTGTCKKGYESNMCHSCEKGYARLYKNQCQSCPDQTSNIFRWLGLFMLLAFISVTIIKSARNSAFKQESFSSIYIKIFWNYLQTMIIIATFNLNWPYELTKLLYIQTCIDYIGAQLFSFDCFLQSSHSKHKVYYDKILITSLTPFFMVLISLIVWSVIYLWKRKSLKEIKNDYISTCVVLIFLIHPSIINTMFNIYSCKEINSGEFWLNNDLGIRCWDHDHIFYAFLLALPTISIWVIAVPALCLVDLLKHRKLFDKTWIKLRYGFFINGFNSKHYYWEFVVLYYKIVLIGCSAFLSNISVNVQALTVAILLALFLHIQAKNQPFTETFFNKAEIFSRIVSLITILAGLFFLTDDLGQVSAGFLLAFVIISNSLFIIYISWKLLIRFSIAKRILNTIYLRRKRFYVAQDILGSNGQELKVESNQSIEIMINSSVIKDAASFEQDPCPSEHSILVDN